MIFFCDNVTTISEASWPQNYFTYDVTKIRNPQPKNFLQCRLEDLVEGLNSSLA